jgi:ATP-dependent DNA helicase RecQ
LDADGQGLYRALLLWRSAQAREAGVPPYVVLTNAQAAALAAERPTNLAGIRNINGMGEKRVAAHGQAILEVIGHGSPEAP